MRAAPWAAAVVAMYGGSAHACPGCGDPAGADRRFDLVITLLIAGSLLLMTRAMFRKWKNKSRKE